MIQRLGLSSYPSFVDAAFNAMLSDDLSRRMEQAAKRKQKNILGACALKTVHFWQECQPRIFWEGDNHNFFSRRTPFASLHDCCNRCFFRDEKTRNISCLLKLFYLQRCNHLCIAGRKIAFYG